MFDKILDKLYGPRKWERYILDHYQNTIKLSDIPGDEKTIFFTLIAMYRGRNKGPKMFKDHTLEGWLVEWACAGGIQTRNDKDPWVAGAFEFELTLDPWGPPAESTLKDQVAWQRLNYAYLWEGHDGRKR